MTDAAGKRYTFGYDDEGRRTETKFNTNADASTWAARTTVDFDKSGRLTRTTSARKSNPNDVVFDVSYCYAKHVAGQDCSTNANDDTGIRQWQTDHVTNTVSVYTFDKGDRLTKATDVHGKTYEYSYDTNGNRKTVKVDGTQTQNLTFNSANQLTTTGETYDKAGHQTGSNFVPGDLTYNAPGQTATINSQPYAYAGTNQTEATRIAGTTIVYGLNNEHGQPWAQSFTTTGGIGYIERDGSGTPLGLNFNGQDHYYVLDGLGSVVAVLDLTGNTAASYTYDPYGAPLTATGPVAAANPIRYTSGLHDTNSGLTKLGERWYNPTLGRFTQQDSIERFADPREGNRYAYAADNPTNNIDPTGKSAGNDYVDHVANWVEVGVAIGAVGGCGAGAMIGGVGCFPGAEAGAIAGAGLGLYYGTADYFFFND
jgi:RHS repeat-associated protein